MRIVCWRNIRQLLLERLTHKKALEAVVPFYFSARTEGSLRSILAAFLKVGSDLETLPLRDIAWTLHRRYEAMPFSFRIEANSHQKLLDDLQTSLREENLELVELAKEPWQRSGSEGC